MKKPAVELDLSALERSIGTITHGVLTDSYKAEAAKMFNVPEDQVTAEQRRYAKQQAFSKIYRGNL